MSSNARPRRASVLLPAVALACSLGCRRTARSDETSGARASDEDAAVLASDAPEDALGDASTSVDVLDAQRARDAAPPPRLAIVDECAMPKRADPATLRIEWGAVYATIGAESLRLDVASPRTEGAHPLVVLIHGGAWAGGERSLHRDDMLRLAGLGYVAATIDYRLTSAPDHAFPAAISDVRCSLRWLRQNAERLAIDPARVAVMGLSAGGHLAALAALAGNDVGEGAASLDEGCASSDQPATVSAGVSFYGPTDLREERRYPASLKTAVRAFLAGDPATYSARAALASPVTHVDADDPPVLVLHGDADRMVPVEDSRQLAAALAEAKVPSLYVEMPKLPHGFLLFGDGAVLRRSMCTTLAFLDATLRR